MSVRILQGDCRDVLKTLADSSVHCVVTSPPYFGLRDYQTASWDGGDPTCDHTARVSGGPKQTPGVGGNGHASAGDKLSRLQCKCGARRIDAQIGLEQSPDAYIAEMVAVFREVRRVLRDDGTLWLNLGDSYNNFRVSKGPGQALHGRDNLHGKPAPDSGGRGWVGAKEKDLLMMPARVALALQADGWFVRSQMPWVKRSCMPESCTDRPTSAIEYVYLLTKSPRYYWDAVAVSRESAPPTGGRQRAGLRNDDRYVGGDFKDYHDGRTGRHQAYQPSSRNFRNSDLFFDSLAAPYGLICDADGNPLALDVNPAAYNDAHFATFSPVLVEPLVKAGTSERGCCAACGAPRVRQTERSNDAGRYGTYAIKDGRLGGDTVSTKGRAGETTSTTTGWLPSCQCNAASVPCVVLDCFAGAFTAPMVADRLQRNAIGIELSAAYCTMARARLVKDAGMFAEIATECVIDAEAGARC